MKLTAPRLTHSLFFLVALLVPQAATAGQFARLVVFGDSLSDPGNAFVLLREVERQPFSLIPDAPYAVGGLHFSNGETWVEDLGQAMQLSASTGPALAKPPTSSNYAVGAARARPGALYDLTTQVGLFLGDANGSASDDALYVVFVGGNDVRDAIVELATDPSGATSMGIINSALGAVRDNLTVLASSGARHFLVANAPNLALVPAVRLQGPAAEGAAHALSDAFNQGLAQVLDGLQAALPVSITRLDVFGVLNQVVADPAGSGLTNVQDPCIVPEQAVSPFCTRPDQYLFWDGIHPTRAGHAILSRAAQAALGL